MPLLIPLWSIIVHGLQQLLMHPTVLNLNDFSIYDLLDNLCYLADKISGYLLLALTIILTVLVYNFKKKEKTKNHRKEVRG